MAALGSNSPLDIEKYVAEQLAALKFPARTIAQLKTGADRKYLAVYVIDALQPAWADTNGVYRYADGVPV